MDGKACLAVIFCTTLVVPTAASPPASAKSEPALETGTVKVCCNGSQDDIPERYRLAPHTFEYQLRRRFELPLSGITVYRLQFPSPVNSGCVRERYGSCRVLSPKER